MLEILIALVIVLMGVLGIAGLIVRSNQAEMESYQRVQALMLVQDMSDRINANRKVAACYSNAGTGMQLGKGYSGTPTCTVGTDAQQQKRAVDDLNAWNLLLLGSGEKTAAGVDCKASPTSCLGAMIDARGCINQIDAVTQTYIVSVAWQGLAATFPSGNACGKDQYGDDSLRRVVTVTFRIGALL